MKISLLLASLLFSVPTFAFDWSEFKSENFTVYSNASPEYVEQQLTSFENYRQGALAFLGLKNKPENKSARVFIFNSRKEFLKYHGNKISSGLYSYTDDGPVMLLYKPGKNSKEAKRYSEEERNLVLFHEYVHYLLRERSSLRYPKWYDEGLSDLLASARIGKAAVSIGVSNVARRSSDNVLQLLEVNDLVAGVRQDQKYVKNFYASSWMLTHFLLLGHLEGGQDFSRKTAEYLAAYNDGQTDIKTFERILGVSSQELTEMVKRYIRKDYLMGMTIDITPYATAIKRRPLSNNEALYSQVNLMFKMGQEKSARKLVKSNKKGEIFYYENQALLAVFLGHREQFSAALKLVDEAVMANPVPAVMVAAGHFYMDYYAYSKNRGKADEAVYQKALKLTLEAYRDDSTRLEAAGNLKNLYRSKDDVVNAVKMMMEQYRATPSRVDLNSEIGLYLADTTSPKMAIPFLEKVLAFSHHEKQKEQARAALEKVLLVHEK